MKETLITAGMWGINENTSDELDDLSSFNLQELANDDMGLYSSRIW